MYGNARVHKHLWNKINYSKNTRESTLNGENGKIQDCHNQTISIRISQDEQESENEDPILVENQAT